VSKIGVSRPTSNPEALVDADLDTLATARSREALRRSELAGWAEDGYCASHSRYFWGLRLHMQKQHSRSN
jgi:hypothetical protein